MYEGLYITAEQASPGQLTLDLPLHTGGGASLIPKVSIEFLRVLPEILGDAGVALVDLRAVNNDVIGLCFLNRSEEHTSELQSLMRISYAVFCLKKKKITNQYTDTIINSINC